jgi:hypothetical protein
MAGQIYLYQTANELLLLDQVFMKDLMASDPIFELFPTEETNQPVVSWEQKDDYLGLMQVRGYNGEFPSIPGTGSKRHRMDPGVYGESGKVDERELTLRAAAGTWDRRVQVDELMRDLTEKLATRRVNRMSWVMWTLLTTGNYSVTGANGAILIQDAFTPQTFASSVAWATVATATPLADIRAMQLLSRGQSVSFGPAARLFMNRTTFNSMQANTNQSDLGGKKGNLGETLTGVDDINRILAKDGLPQIVVYDGGYLDDSGTFKLWIPNNKTILVGARTNRAVIGKFLLTTNKCNPDGSSRPYYKVYDSAKNPYHKGAPELSAEAGFNGGPAIFYPGAVIQGSH